LRTALRNKKVLYRAFKNIHAIYFIFAKFEINRAVIACVILTAGSHKIMYIYNRHKMAPICSDLVHFIPTVAFFFNKQSSVYTHQYNKRKPNRVMLSGIKVPA